MSAVRVLTRTGKVVDLLEPTIDMIDGYDIAHALGNLCRFNGHTERFYSVAEHCVLISQAVAPEHALWGLLHDATEAYVGDMVRPLKQVIPEFKMLEDRIMGVIAARFGLVGAVPVEIKQADRRIYVDERRALAHTGWKPGGDTLELEPLGVTVQGWGPDFARRVYLEQLCQLLGVSRYEADRVEAYVQADLPMCWVAGSVGTPH